MRRGSMRMRLVFLTVALLFANLGNDVLSASAFSHTHRRSIASSLLRNNVKHRIRAPPSRRNNVDGSNRGRSRLQCTQALPKNVDADLAPAGGMDDVSAYYDRLMSQFHGDFDNYNQVVRDRRRGLTPGAGGGHEHIHCTLVPCPRNDVVVGDRRRWILAAFYLDGNPRRIFRFRAYQLIPPSSDDELRAVRMKLHTLSPDLEAKLRQCSERPCSWWTEAWNIWRKLEHHDGIMDGDEWNELQTVGMPAMVSPLVGCDILWDPNWDPSKHPYLYVSEYDDSPPIPAASTEPTLPTGRCCHATMEAGSDGAIVDSISMIPGKRILIKDELSLWDDEFWINDRGYDPDVEGELDETNEVDGGGMPFVYGNQRGVPYKLQRVSEVIGGADARNQKSSDLSLTLERVITNPGLKWTLGDDFRTSDLYQKRMQAVEKATS